MRFYNVVVHGRFDQIAHKTQQVDGSESLPKGFYCNRPVVAKNMEAAAQKAFAKTRAELERNEWLATAGATVTLEAEQTTPTNLLALIRHRGGFTFYEAD